jgi:Fur family ferric uptake transcriptional regulator
MKIKIREKLQKYSGKSFQAKLFADFLKYGNYKVTPERVEVLEYILKLNRYFSADELYLQIRNDKRQISRATVYNTLRLLCMSGFIIKKSAGRNNGYKISDSRIYNIV